MDPFDLPEWLAEGEVMWTAASALRGRHRVRGELRGHAGHDTKGPVQSLVCDLLAVDQAWPQPVLDEPWRRAAHGEWSRGELLLARVQGRLTLVTPGTVLDAERVLETLGRLARSVGVSPSRFLVALRP